MTSPFVGAVVLGDDRLRARMLADNALAETMMRSAVSDSADLALTKIRANASGRPGPNAPTGDYRRSWSRQTRQSAREFSVSVGTNRPQARRLEFGFVGQDSLGRNYHQPPYPHVEPAIPLIEEFFVRRMDEIARLIAEGGGSVRVGGSTG